MIKLVAKGYFYEDKIDEAINLYKELAKASRTEKGCIEYKLFQEKNDKTILTVYEEWENEESIKKHKNSEHFKKIVPILSSLRIKVELNAYELVL